MCDVAPLFGGVGLTQATPPGYESSPAPPHFLIQKRDVAELGAERITLCPIARREWPEAFEKGDLHLATRLDRGMDQPEAEKNPLHRDADRLLDAACAARHREEQHDSERDETSPHLDYSSASG